MFFALLFAFLNLIFMKDHSTSANRSAVLEKNFIVSSSCLHVFNLKRIFVSAAVWVFCFVFFEVYLSVATKIWTSHNQILIKLTRSEANISSNNFRHRNLALSISRAHQYFIPLISLLTFLQPGFLGKKIVTKIFSYFFAISLSKFLGQEPGVRYKI